MDLGKLNFLWLFKFKLELIYTTAPTASKNDACFKSIDSRLIISLCLSKSVTHSGAEEIFHFNLIISVTF